MVDGDVDDQPWVFGAVHRDIRPTSGKVDSYRGLHRDFSCHGLAQFGGLDEEWHSRQVVLWKGHPEGRG